MNSCILLDPQSQIVVAVYERKAIDIEVSSESELNSILPICTINFGDNKGLCCDR